MFKRNEMKGNIYIFHPSFVIFFTMFCHPAPGPPAAVVLTTEDLTINVTWTEPEQKNGIIDYYEVQWAESTGYNGSHKTEDNSTFSFEIVEVSCGVPVNVTVRAKVESVADFGEKSPPETAIFVNSGK